MTIENLISTVAVASAEEIRMGESASLRFEGYRYGSEISFFLVTNQPGQGPDLHRHPYTETWTVLEGEATIRVGEETIVATAGTKAVSPADTWHGFKNTGTGTLRLMGIHASDHIIQEWQDEDEA